MQNLNQALWEMGDFTQIAKSMRRSGKDFITRLNLTPNTKILDLGCGDGNTAIPAALLGAEVLGIDIAENLVEAGNQRAKKYGISNCRFEQGDARMLTQVADQSMDMVISIFGAMFAPDPLRVAQEMVRVTRPAGKIVMGNWIPEDPTLVAQILKISARYTPPPPAGFVSPMNWGDIGKVSERFESAGIHASKIKCMTDTWKFEYGGTPEEYARVFRTFYGPTMKAFEAADASGKSEELWGELVELFSRCNVSLEPNQTIIPATYLRVIVSV